MSLLKSILQIPDTLRRICEALERICALLERISDPHDVRNKRIPPTWKKP